MVPSAAVIPDSAAKLRQTALRALGELPPFSPVLSRLLATLAKEDVSFGALGDLIEKDTVVAGNVLHLVNSAIYARRSKINSVRHAISVLGVNKLRNAVLGMSVARMWKSVTMPAGWSTARFNAHSAGTAIMSDLLVQHLDVKYPEGAFIGGLLHDIGQLLVAWSLPKQYEEIRSRHGSGTPLEECEREILGFTHAELSGDALEVWKLPEPVQVAVRMHHTAGDELSMGKAIGAADAYIKSIGLSTHPLPGPQPEGPDMNALLALGLDPKLVDALTGDFETEVKAMMQYLQ
jgi:HD-like signal output (HDOD) protein